MADGGQVERFVVVSACGEHRAIAQSRCLRLTGTDYTYIHTYFYTNGGQQRITITCLAFRLGNYCIHLETFLHLNVTVTVVSVMNSRFCNNFLLFCDYHTL